MFLIRVAVEDSQGRSVAGFRVLASFQLQLAGAGEDLFMPAEAVGALDADGRSTLRLPAAAGIGDEIRLIVRGADGQTLLDVVRNKAELVSHPEQRLVVGGPTQPTVLSAQFVDEVTGAALTERPVVIVARARGASGFAAVLAGRTDPSGVLSGPWPPGPFEEATAMVRGEGNLTVPLELTDGRFPATMVVRVPSLGSLPTLSASPLPVPPPAPAPAVQLLLP